LDDLGATDDEIQPTDPARHFHRFVGLGRDRSWILPGASSAFVSKTIFPVQPHETDIIIKTSVDPNFFIELSTSSEGTPLDVSQCATRSNQHWTFLQSADNSIVIADGAGHCLGYTKSVPLGTVDGPCTFKAGEHFCSRVLNKSRLKMGRNASPTLRPARMRGCSSRSAWPGKPIRRIRWLYDGAGMIYQRVDLPHHTLGEFDAVLLGVVGDEPEAGYRIVSTSFSVA
jgi:hypothetical protein